MLLDVFVSNDWLDSRVGVVNQKLVNCLQGHLRLLGCGLRVRVKTHDLLLVGGTVCTCGAHCWLALCFGIFGRGDSINLSSRLRLLIPIVISIISHRCTIRVILSSLSSSSNRCTASFLEESAVLGRSRCYLLNARCALCFHGLLDRCRVFGDS